MVRKSDLVREAVANEDWKKALKIAKDFRIGITKKERDLMTRAYECLVFPEFYKQLGIDLQEAIEYGKETVKKYAERTTKETA